MRIEEKVPGGKMVCIDLETADGRISRIKITGDFFLHPEDTLEKIEKALVGIQVDDKIADVVEKVVSDDSARMIGFSPQDIERMIREAVG